MELAQHGFSDSTTRACSDKFQKSAKSLLSALMSISQIITQKYASADQLILAFFKAQEKFFQ